MREREVAGGTKTRFHWEGLNLYMEEEWSGSAWIPKRTYINQPSALGGALVRFDLGTSNTLDSSDSGWFYHYDEAGNVILITDKNGGLIKHFEQDAWGNDLNGSFSTTQNIRQHQTGKYLDEATGLYFFGARWYDPNIGRFISVSPLSPLGEEEYVYCGDNPINASDFNGNDWDKLNWIPYLPEFKEWLGNKINNWLLTRLGINDYISNSNRIGYYSGAPNNGYSDLNQACQLASDTIGTEMGWAIITGGLSHIRLPSKLLRNESKIARAMQSLEDFLGSNTRSFRNKSGDLIIESADGLRQVRFDFNNYIPHDKPHIHIIEWEYEKNGKKILSDKRIFYDE